MNIFWILFKLFLTFPFLISGKEPWRHGTMAHLGSRYKEFEILSVRFLGGDPLSLIIWNLFCCLRYIHQRFITVFLKYKLLITLKLFWYLFTNYCLNLNWLCHFLTNYWLHKDSYWHLFTNYCLNLNWWWHLLTNCWLH